MRLQKGLNFILFLLLATICIAKTHSLKSSHHWENVTHKKQIVFPYFVNDQNSLTIERVFYPNDASVLNISGISADYQIWVNDKPISKSWFPPFKNQQIPIQKQTKTKIKIILKSAGLPRFGLTTSIKLVNNQKFQNQIKTTLITEGILLGILIITFFTYLTLFLFFRKHTYFLFYAGFAIIVFIHFICLIDKTSWSIFSDKYWPIIYRIELVTVFLGVAFKLHFYQSFFNRIIPNKLYLSIIILFYTQSILILVLPYPTYTWMDNVIPYNLLITLSVALYAFIRANKEKMLGSTTITLLNIMLMSVLVKENLLLNKSMLGINYIHVVVIFYLLGVSTVLIQRIIQIFKNEQSLIVQLEYTSQKLDSQRKNLEEIVNLRTTQLLEAEKISHQLVLDKKEKDLELLAANNIMKAKFNQNLIKELSNLPKNEHELKIAVQQLIIQLKNQLQRDEKQSILEKDLERLNSEFFERLSLKYPSLSKTEREICAYIRLNLSNKEIADLRQTSLNTINVTRSRLRKKLNLQRDDELEQFIISF
jgi:DNA-binding CsgD family transcriptional regulator